VSLLDRLGRGWRKEDVPCGNRSYRVSVVGSCMDFIAVLHLFSGQLDRSDPMSFTARRGFIADSNGSWGDRSHTTCARMSEENAHAQIRLGWSSFSRIAPRPISMISIRRSGSTGSRVRTRQTCADGNMFHCDAHEIPSRQSLNPALKKRVQLWSRVRDH